jgi:hypothetical protein
MKLLVFTRLLLLTITPHSHDIQHLLLNKWKLEEYQLDGEYFPPSKKEKSDFIHFHENMSFTSLSESKHEQGSYIINVNGEYVEMTSETGEKLKAYIISISSEMLVLQFDFEEAKGLRAYYKATFNR